MQILYRVCYKRKDSKDWPEQTIDMTLESKENILKEFGTMQKYLASMISGGVRITDHYLIKTTDVISL